MRWKTLTLLCGKCTRHNIGLYRILSESTRFDRRYDKNILVCFLGSQCIGIHGCLSKIGWTVSIKQLPENGQYSRRILKNDFSFHNDDDYVVAEISKIMMQRQTQTAGALRFEPDLPVDIDRNRQWRRFFTQMRWRIRRRWHRDSHQKLYNAPFSSKFCFYIVAVWEIFFFEIKLPKTRYFWGTLPFLIRL